MNRIFKLILIIVFLFTNLLSSNAQTIVPPTTKSADEVLDVNNKWQVRIRNSLNIDSSWVFISLKKIENHWEIHKISEKFQVIDKSIPLEQFAATKDLQEWTNAHFESRIDCNTFEEKQSDNHSVCSSSLAEKKVGLTFVKLLFFGGSGKTQFSYTDSKVQAAINSIPIEQALSKLKDFESR